MKALTYNPEKEIMTAIAVLIFSFALMAKVNGQGSDSHFAMIPAEYESDSEDSFMSNLSDTEYIESEPMNEIQGWMLSNTYWGNPVSAEETEIESGLQIEKWMSSDNYWGVRNNPEIMETEEPLQIERWMTSNKYFGYQEPEVESEKELKIEQWMNSTTYWTGEYEELSSPNLAGN